MKRVLLFLTVLLVVLALFAACGEDAPDLPDTSETPTTETPTPTVYTITYELNGGTNAQSNPATYTAESATIAFADPTRTGYTFAGWSITSIPQGSTGNKTVTASWTPIVYTITYELGGGENAATNPATYTIETATIAFADPTRTGYDFAGWDIATIPQGSTGNKTVTASWTLRASQGLEYESNGNGTCYVSGIGTCTDTDIDIPPVSPDGDTVTAIGNGAFDSQAITSVKIPAGVTTVGSQAFYGCGALTSVELSEGVESIGSQAFSNCTVLTKVTIPPSVMNIGDFAFYGCAGLADIYYDGTQAQWDAITKGSGWDNSAGAYKVHFQVSKGLEFESNEDGTCTLIGIGECTDTDLVIPNESPEGDTVTAIGAGAFSYEALTSVFIPNTVETIGESAFYGCEDMVSVIFEEDSALTLIDEFAFNGCYALESINIPKSVETIGMQAFAYCSALTAVTFEDGSELTSLGEEVFEGCELLESIAIPKGVTSLEYAVFYGCTALTTVTFEDGSELTSIGASAFSGCTALTGIVIPKSVETIGDDAFYGCSELASLIFEADSQLTSIGDSAFSDCVLVSITIPKRVTSIGMYAFSCDTLETVEFEADSELETIGYGAFYSTALMEITIPASVTCIEPTAFDGCTALGSVTFENETGWYVTMDEGATGGTPMDVTDPNDNANNLQCGQFGEYYWYRA